MALYRKYRPATFAEVVGQEHVTEPLSTALDTGRINHAYLFSGPRGCGKTSSARILARSLNCEQGPTASPCGQCESCVALAPGGPGNLDVIELDAASHGGVDDTRELRDRAFYAPATSRYRVFIVDEAHMVTTAGFNALLKIVEEPPAHLIFIFATTEPDKVLPTIRSRTHHYPFRLLPPATMRGLLGRICEQEHVAVEEAVYPLVIRAGGGSPRDSLSVLDQLLAGAGEEGVTYHRAVSLLGVTDVALIDDAVTALAGNDGAALFGTVDRVMEAGHDPRRFAVDLLERFRDLILMRAVPDAVDRGLVAGPGDVLDRMREQAESIGPAGLTRFAELLHEGLGEMRGATAPRLLLEVVCARMLLPAVSDSEAATLQRIERLERGLASGVSLPAAAPAPAADADAAPSARPSTADPSRRRGAEAIAALRQNKASKEVAAPGRADDRPAAEPAAPISGAQGAAAPAAPGAPPVGDGAPAHDIPATGRSAAGTAAASGQPGAGGPHPATADEAVGTRPEHDIAGSADGPAAHHQAVPDLAVPIAPAATSHAGQSDDDTRDAARTGRGPAGAGPAAGDRDAGRTGRGPAEAGPDIGGDDAARTGRGPVEAGPDAGGRDAGRTGPGPRETGPGTGATREYGRPARDAGRELGSGDAVRTGAEPREDRRSVPGPGDGGHGGPVPAGEDAAAHGGTPEREGAGAGPARSPEEVLRAVDGAWPQIRAKVREYGPASIPAMLSGASVIRVDDDAIVFAHPTAVLVGRLSEPRSIEAIRSAIREVLGIDHQVRWEGGAAARPQAQAPRSKQGAAQADRTGQGGAPQGRGGPAGPAQGKGGGQGGLPRFSRPSQANAAAAGAATSARPKRSAPAGYDDIPPPDFPDLPDDPGSGDYPPPDPAQFESQGPGEYRTGVVPGPPTDEEEREMLAEAARPVAPEDRRDPDEVALELLRAELGATRMDG